MSLRDDSDHRDPCVARLGRHTSRRKLLDALAAWFNDTATSPLDWDALQHGKRDAWPMPDLSGGQAEDATSCADARSRAALAQMP
jgi:hypothetical protein